MSDFSDFIQDFIRGMPESLLVVGSAVAVGVVFGIIWFLLERRSDARNMLSQEQKEVLTQEVLRMIRTKATYEQKMAFLRSKGLTKRIAYRILVEAERMSRRNSV